MDPVPFTVKHSKALKSSSGRIREISVSNDLHSKFIPLLVSSLVLRSRGQGQIDIAYFKKDSLGYLVEVVEVKSSMTGVVAYERSQKNRIDESLNFIGRIFNLRVRKCIKKVG